MRSFLITVHRYLGLASAVFLTLASLTGCVLVFDQGLDAALNPDLFRVAVRTPVLTGPDLAARVAAADPTLDIASLPLQIQPGHAVRMELASGDQIFVDPADGHLVGRRDGGPGWDRRHLVQGIFRFHYTLLAGDVGRWLMGIVALGWLIANGVGFYLTLPTRGPFWPKWRPMWQVKLKANPLRLLLDLHRASGLWLLIGVVMLSFTSAALNLYDELYRPAIAALSPPAETPWDRPLPVPRSEPRPIGFEAALRHGVAFAARDRLDLIPATLRHFPDRQLYGIEFTPTGADEYRGLGPVSYLLDDRTGALVFIDNPWTDSVGQKLLRGIYPLHSGQVGGLPTRLLVGLLGLATIEMAVTGIIAWWRKRAARVLRRRSVVPTEKNRS